MCSRSTTRVAFGPGSAAAMSTIEELRLMGVSRQNSVRNGKARFLTVKAYSQIRPEHFDRKKEIEQLYVGKK